MRVFNYAADKDIIPAEKRAVALGFFDGVHIGHRKILSLTARSARERGLTPAVFTFISESKELKLGTHRLYTTREKLSLIEECGIEEVFLFDFQSLCNMSGEDFVNELLVKELSARLAVCGGDFRFGKGAASGVDELSSLMGDLGGEAIIAEDVTLDGKRASTTYIKELLREGNIALANSYLGSPYLHIASVEEGRGIGRSLGFPTINSSLGIKAGVLRRGVYISEVIIDSIAYPALTNIGICPTFDERCEHAETYIIGYEGDLYGKNVTIYFHSFLRDEIKFSSKNELILQIKVDINRAKEEFLTK